MNSNFIHSWRHLEATVEYVTPADPEHSEIITTDTWYCVRCRKIETSERERMPAEVET